MTLRKSISITRQATWVKQHFRGTGRSVPSCLRWYVSVGCFFVFLQTSSLLCAGPVTVVSLPFSGVGDVIDRGFYVESYPANNVDTVELRYGSSTPGDYSIALTIREDTYDGALVGTRNLNLSLLADVPQFGVFDFEAALTPVGGRLTLIQELLSGPDTVYYDVGPGLLGDDSGPPTGVVETKGTTPPLSSFRRNGVGVVITAVPEPGSVVLAMAGATLWILMYCCRGRRVRGDD